MAKLSKGHHDKKKIIKNIATINVVEKAYQQIIIRRCLEYRHFFKMGPALGLPA